MNFQIFLQIILNSLLPISVLALATLGIVLIFRTSTTTNFAQGMIATVGTYAATMLTLKAGLNIWLSILIGVVIGFVIGLFIDAVIFRRAKYANPIGKQMITMGVVLLITGLLPIIFTDAFTTPPDGYKFVEGNDWINFYDGQVVMSNHAVISVIIAVVIIAAVFLALRFTKWGLGVRATASNELVSGMMGINTHLITALSWAIAGGIGTIASLMLAPTTMMSAGMMTPIQVNAFLACILGGFNSFVGPIVGTIVIPLFGNFIGWFESVWKDIIIYVFILVIILIRPYGLFGKKITKKV